MLKKNKIELLAPAGNMECFIAACNAGADAIYMGMPKFNARTMAQNFTEEQFIAAIDYAHLRGIKVYLTLNTLMYDEEIKEALEMVLKLDSYGLDAVILQDIGLARLIHKMLPNLHLHASTQMSVYSLEQAYFLQSIGFTRIVLARELTLDEIKYIGEHLEAEIEVFVHGALCVSLSGQCLLSSTIGNRSANRGRCAQPCRMRYSLLNSKGKILQKEQYLLSKKDIYGLPHMAQIFQSHIDSIKIEGRNKTPEYVALVVSKYRKYIDQYSLEQKLEIEQQDEEEIMQMFNRDGKSSGYLDHVKYQESITLHSPKNTGIYLGRVINQRKMYVQVKLEKNIDLHDGIEIYSEEDVVSTVVTCIKDENGNTINKEAKAGECVWLGDISKKIKFGSSIYKTSCYTLNKNISKTFVHANRNQRKLNVDIKIKKEERIQVRVWDEKEEIFMQSMDIVPEKAIKKALSKEDVVTVFSKTLDTAFSFCMKNVILDEDVFVPISVLNEIRRNIVSKLEEKWKIRRQVNKINLEDILKLKQEKVEESVPCNALFIYQYHEDINYLEKYQTIDRIDISIQDFMKYEESIFSKYGSKVEIALYIPNFVLKNLDKWIKQNLERIILRGIDTVILSSFSYLELIQNIRKKKKLTLIADEAFNITNVYSALFMKEIGFDVIVPAFDMEISHIKDMAKYVKLELVKDYVTVMTSRYCILGSFVANRSSKKCSMPCLKENYILKDSYGFQYAIICDHIDCIMRLVKERKNIDQNSVMNIYGMRKAII